MVSTSRMLRKASERTEEESESTCVYKRLFLDYTYGLNKIYTQDEITAAQPEIFRAYR